MTTFRSRIFAVEAEMGVRCATRLVSGRGVEAGLASLDVLAALLAVSRHVMRDSATFSAPAYRLSLPAKADQLRPAGVHGSTP